MGDAKGSPRPWRAAPPDGSYHDVIRIYGHNQPDGSMPVAVCPQHDSPVMAVLAGQTNGTTVAAANASLILSSVNARDEAIEAMEAALAHIESSHRAVGIPSHSMEKRLRAAIEKLKGVPNA